MVLYEAVEYDLNPTTWEAEAKGCQDWAWTYYQDTDWNKVVILNDPKILENCQ